MTKRGSKPLVEPSDAVWRSLAELEVVGSPTPGRREFRLLDMTTVRIAALLVALFAVAAGALQYLYKIDAISQHVKNLYEVAYYACFSLGGLKLMGCLDIKKALTVALSVAAFQAWQIAFIDHPNPAFYLFYAVPACWYMFWWVRTEPQMMETFGLRRDRLFADLAAALTLSVLILGYMLVMFMVFGYELAGGFWTGAKYAANQLPQALILSCFFFAVWNELNRNGSTPLWSAVAVTLMLVLLALPLLGFLLAAGFIEAKTFFLGISFNVLFFALAMLLTFRSLGNALPAAFLITTLMILSKLAGLI